MPLILTEKETLGKLLTCLPQNLRRQLRDGLAEFVTAVGGRPAGWRPPTDTDREVQKEIIAAIDSLLESQK